MAEQKNPQAQENVSSQNINELIRVRREKLAALQEAGKDPFTITKYNQTHHTDEVKSLYNDHEAKLLAGRVRPSTEGLDEQQAKDVINEDYNERRAIMDADPIEVSIAGRMMFKRVMGKASFCNIADLKGNIQLQRTQSARKHTQISRSPISAISTVLRDMFSEQRQMRFPYMQRKSHFCPSHFRCSRRSSMELPTQIQDTARDTLTS